MISFWIGVLVCLAACVLFGIIPAVVYVIEILKTGAKS